MNLASFIKEISRAYDTGKATEHSYRFALQTLFDSIDPGNIKAINEPARTNVGAPDFILQRGDAVIGHVEAKDIPVDIRNLKDANQEQQTRYRNGFGNLIYTNGLEWDFYRNGECVDALTIGHLRSGRIQAKRSEFNDLENHLREFARHSPVAIKSPDELAKCMAGKAGLIKNVLFGILNDDKDMASDLGRQFKAFQKLLINDIKPDDFADIYAETIVYGMFAARLHADGGGDAFSRRNAAYLIPKSNRFLQRLFSYVAGPNLDERISWIIDDLAIVFRACDMDGIMKGYGERSGQQDPFLHFYETFLAAYNPEKRRVRGVWYTPEPVVDFIARAVDKVLRTEFGLRDGLADTSKTTVGRDDKTKDVHRVQILDPAVGTGTFLAKVIKLIEPRIKDNAQGFWSKYVEKELIPRLHGFELLMAPYAMCHLKLDRILRQMGYEPSGNPPRLSVFLTNALEKGEPANETFAFDEFLSDEAAGANAIKRDKPIMCVIGNPPYARLSQNNGKWARRMIEPYKCVDGQHIKERNHWLHNDYIKFIRLAESYIEKRCNGVLGFITDNGYLDNPTVRGMRWHLLQSFDKIYILDLHGNSKVKEQSPDGRPDENVFDIQQGVAILIAVKTGGKSAGSAEIFHGEIWGTRERKYRDLAAMGIDDPLFQKIESPKPQCSFVPRDYGPEKAYMSGFKLTKFMPENVTGIVTSRDDLAINFTTGELTECVNRFVDPSKTDEQVRHEFFSNRKAGKYPPGDTREWKLPAARRSLQSVDWEEDIKPIAYRPFDNRFILYRADMVDWRRRQIMRHMLDGANMALATARSIRGDILSHFFVVDRTMESKCAERSKTSYVFPLYLYSDGRYVSQTRKVNFDREIYGRIRSIAAEDGQREPDEIAVFDYVYGVLHCPAYRKTFAEFIKRDYPRIPWPTSSAEFWDVSAKGSQIRRLHLMDNEIIGQTPYPVRGNGDGIVGNPTYRNGKVRINKRQYFDNVPEVAWDFYIGGYQPARQWLKSRKRRKLEHEDILHYQKVLKILAETDRIMNTITMTLEI